MLNDGGNSSQKLGHSVEIPVVLNDNCVGSSVVVVSGEHIIADQV